MTIYYIIAGSSNHIELLLRWFLMGVCLLLTTMISTRKWNPTTPEYYPASQPLIKSLWTPAFVYFNGTANNNYINFCRRWCTFKSLLQKHLHTHILAHCIYYEASRQNGIAGDSSNYWPGSLHLWNYATLWYLVLVTRATRETFMLTNNPAFFNTWHVF